MEVGENIFARLHHTLKSYSRYYALGDSSRRVDIMAETVATTDHDTYVSR